MIFDKMDWKYGLKKDSTKVVRIVSYKKQTFN